MLNDSISREKKENMKTKCCYTKHYAHKEDSTICTNTLCANYLSVTPLVKQNRVKRFLTAAWLLFFLVVFTSTDFSNINSEEINRRQSELTKRMCVSLTRESLRNEMNEVQIICAEEAFA